jgi:hypothetical protein
MRVTIFFAFAGKKYAEVLVRIPEQAKHLQANNVSGSRWRRGLHCAEGKYGLTLRGAA